MCQVLGQHWVVMVVVVVLVLIPFPQTCTEPSTLFWLRLFLFPALYSYIPYQRDASSAQNLWETLHYIPLDAHSSEKASMI